ncbi:hypothetical protein PR202_gb19576 [Eleusine coracana subsp. coracana]|uniref:Uncharacterized protein n=1 Tax=Eleusine coracana subsp. coracana TaxID=191504 RepID=A0AAV5F6E7_ELECO|nr:hypothetical protein PR202_gb19576 [Eleusine coracana subsp. coracana]
MMMPPPNDANGGSTGEGHEIVEVIDDHPGTPSGTLRLMDFIPIYIPTVEKGALSRSRRKQRRFLDFLRAHPSKDWFLRSTFVGRLRFRGPLGRKRRPDEPSAGTAAAEHQGTEEESSGAAEQQGNEEDVEIKIYNRRVVVSSPEWSGGLLDCGDDATVCAASACCTLCVFGWNMERLGLGNMYVHAFTFALLLAAPFLIFSVTALNLHDPDVRDVVVAAGVFLGFCGFMYGGFWRTQMRKRYKLPAAAGCGCGTGAVGAAVDDCARWLFCWSCALAQEVRTANFYDVEDDRFVVAVLDARNQVLVPLPREATTTMMHSRSMSCPPKIAHDGATSPLGLEMAISMERSATYHPMSPPMPPLIHMDQQQ